MQRRVIIGIGAAVAVAAVAAAAFGGGTARATPAGVAPGITEASLPAGFTKSPAVTVGGKRYRFDAIPGHYWKVLDRSGYAVGLHFQTDQPFPWAKDVPKGELLYLIYAIPGTCGDGNYAKAVKAPNATIQGKAPPGFDHWHGLHPSGGSTVGHWYMHVAVRDFTFAGPTGNPFEGKPVAGGSPKFLPVCDIIK